MDLMNDLSTDLGLLRAKMSELNTEMARLHQVIERNNKEQQSLPSLEKRVKDMALEMTGTHQICCVNANTNGFNDKTFFLL